MKQDYEEGNLPTAKDALQTAKDAIQADYEALINMVTEMAASDHRHAGQRHLYDHALQWNACGRCHKFRHRFHNHSAPHERRGRGYDSG